MNDTASVVPVARKSVAPIGLTPYWLPELPEFVARVKALEALSDPAAIWAEIVALADTRLDFVRTLRLDRILLRHFGSAPPPKLATRPIKLAVLGSSTLAHLVPSMRIAAARRGIWLRVYEGDYGQYLQELSDPAAPLHDFKPDAVLLALDAPHLLRASSSALSAEAADQAVAAVTAQLRECWRRARDAFGCQILQQTVLPVFSPLLGNNEYRLPGSAAALAQRLNLVLRSEADAGGVDLVAIDERALGDGIAAWHDPMLWHRAKQEITPAAAPIYGELVGRLIAARQGRSRKCLVLDLDNTLWGGVIGDDGLEGIVVGQGSALGEAFVAVQHYARELARRGVILAVCSKNDDENARAPFEKHPDMLLKQGDIACFVANWQDKATNIRTIAERLNIGLDSLVFLDDNPFERNLVRRELPMVAVPEVPGDPALYPRCLADAGYFESLAVTDEDRSRSEQYQANLAREAFASQTTDLPSYLRQLEMRLVVAPFNRLGLQRIVQLINKTNQFNLTTRRYTDEEVVALMDDRQAFGLQFRLVDRFGDNGIIGIVIGRKTSADEVLIDTWLMSCRVLGRGVEEAMLNVVVGSARRLGGDRLIGEYRPTAKNRMVCEHYGRLGFSRLQHQEDVKLDVLDLNNYVPVQTFIEVDEE
jgi:FkbH-like protein